MSETITTETPVSCPPSTVHDAITTWTSGDGSLNVQPGDLIVWVSDFRLVLTIEPHPSETGVMVLLDDMPWPTFCRGDGLVAVRRYDTGEG
jgi:hypothetical protein